MKGLLKGKVNLGEREFETSFISVRDFLISDYLLYRDCGQSYRLSYKGIEIELDEDMSFMEVKAAIYSNMVLIDKALGGR